MENSRIDESRIEAIAKEEERKGLAPKCARMKAEYFDAMAGIAVARQNKRLAESLGALLNAEIELNEERARLQVLFRQNVEREGYLLAWGLLKKTFREAQDLPYMAGWVNGGDVDFART